MNSKFVIAIVIVLTVVIGGVLIFLNNSPVDNRCLITVDSKTYDVTQLRNTHTGGDMFECGTDMTKDFKEEHGTRYSLIEPYEV